VSFPHESLPLPEKGILVPGVSRACQDRVLRVQRPESFDLTAVITLLVPKEPAMEVRSMKP
jgi:hypothetical protein